MQCTQRRCLLGVVAPRSHKGRRILVGDVQGCLDELERLLEKVRFDPSVDELHPVGDFVNRGPDSLGVLRLCRELDAGGVLGNHDLHLFACLRGERTPKDRDTFEDVLRAEDRDELTTWLAQRPFVRAWRDLFLVHAGFHPRWKDPAGKLERASVERLTEAAQYAVTVRTCNAKGEQGGATGEGASPPYRPWYQFYDPSRHGGRRVVFGHWSVRGLVLETNAIGLDTGCVWGRELSAFIPEEDRIVRVKARRSYSPVR